MEKTGDRIQKVLSDNGVMSRRKAEDAIRQRRVQVNGRPAEIGQKINPRKDIIAIDGVNVELQRRKNNVYIMLNKPRGYVTTTSDEMGRACVSDLVADVPEKVYPIGRLDKVSEGLLLLTNDGNFANTVMHPRNHISKTYRATVRPEVSEDQLIKLSTGVEIDGKKTLPATVHVLTRESGRTVLQITIYEGRNRQIRKMCEALGLVVARLKRVSVGPVKLGMLQPGAWRELTTTELTALRAASKKAQDKATQEKIDERVAREGSRSQKAKTQSRSKPEPDKRTRGRQDKSAKPAPDGRDAQAGKAARKPERQDNNKSGKRKG